MVKAGFGNYLTPYLEGYLHNGRSRKHSIGSHFKHYSSGGKLENVGGFSGFSENQLALYGKKFLSKHLLSGDIGFNRNVAHYYGNDSAFSKEDIRQRVSVFDASVRLQSQLRDSSKLIHDIGLNFFALNDFYGFSETNINLDGNLSTYMNKDLLGADFKIDYWNNKDSAEKTNDNVLIHLLPAITTQGERYHVKVGFSMTGVMGKEPLYYGFPYLNARYDLVKDLMSAFAKVDRDVIHNSFQGYFNENPFVSSSAPIFNTVKRWGTRVGINGALSSKTTYNLSAGYAKYDNLPFYYNEQQVFPRKFLVSNDSVNVMNLHGELLYKASDKLEVILKADYFDYTTFKQQQIYYRPSIRSSIYGKYKVGNKLIVKANIFYLGPQYGVEGLSFSGTESDNVVELKGIVDVNLGLEYRYSKILSAFVSFNNMASVRYYRWHSYPTQRINVLGGLTYSF